MFLSYPFIEETRSFGFIFAVILKEYGKFSTTDLILKIKDSLLKEGILIGFSLGKSQIRFLPPLTIKDDEIDFLQQKILKVFDQIS